MRFGLFKQLVALEKSMGEVAEDVRKLALQIEYHRGYTAAQLDMTAKLAQRYAADRKPTRTRQNATHPSKSNPKESFK